MKIFKLAIISIVGLFLVITAMSLLLPSTVIISRAININQPFNVVYPLVNNVHQWQKWMDLYDSSQVKTSGITSGKGASISLGDLRIKIFDTTSHSISAYWQTGDNKPLPGKIDVIANDSTGPVTVQWQFTQTVKWYPWQKFATIVSDQALGPTMEKSLDNLKKLAEDE